VLHAWSINVYNTVFVLLFDRVETENNISLCHPLKAFVDISSLCTFIQWLFKKKQKDPLSIKSFCEDFKWLG